MGLITQIIYVGLKLSRSSGKTHLNKDNCVSLIEVILLTFYSIVGTNVTEII